MDFSPGKELTEQHASSFALAAQFLPERTRNEVYSLYGFCRATDQILDGRGTREQKECSLSEWEENLAHAWEGQTNPLAPIILRDFVRTCRAHSISQEWGFHLIQGLKGDLGPVRMPTFSALREYCFSAGAIPGILMAHVLDANPATYPHALALGMGMQLTNILRDIKEDFENERVYLPLNEMKKFGYTLDDLAAGRVNKAFIRLMAFNLERARAYYAEAEAGINDLPPRVQEGIRLSLLFYREILSEIEHVNYDVFSHRVFVPDSRKKELIQQVRVSRAPFIEA